MSEEIIENTIFDILLIDIMRKTKPQLRANNDEFLRILDTLSDDKSSQIVKGRGNETTNKDMEQTNGLRQFKKLFLKMNNLNEKMRLNEEKIIGIADRNQKSKRQRVKQQKKKKFEVKHGTKPPTELKMENELKNDHRMIGSSDLCGFISCDPPTSNPTVNPTSNPTKSPSNTSTKSSSTPTKSPSITPTNQQKVLEMKSSDYEGENLLVLLCCILAFILVIDPSWYSVMVFGIIYVIGVSLYLLMAFGYLTKQTLDDKTSSLVKGFCLKFEDGVEANSLMKGFVDLRELDSMSNLDETSNGSMSLAINPPALKISAFEDQIGDADLSDFTFPIYNWISHLVMHDILKYLNCYALNARIKQLINLNMILLFIISDLFGVVWLKCFCYLVLVLKCCLIESIFDFMNEFGIHHLKQK